MPTVTVDERALLERLGRTEVNEEAVTWFDDLCFRFGIELDGIEEGENGSGRKYKIDIGANRYDLLCLEGIARSLNAFLGRQPTPTYKGMLPKKDPVRIIVDPSTKNVRPFVVGAVLRNITVNEAVYTTLIDLQEKLHMNICRKRLFVAIGVHDMSKIKGPFTYKAVEPKKIKFKPLNQTKEFRADELMEHYKSDLHLRSYLHIIEGEELYPLIVDSNGVVLSMPPIINGDWSKVTVDDTKPVDLFFECTATDLGKASTVIDTLTTMLSEYTSFEVEKVEVVYMDRTETYPSLSYRKEVISVVRAVSVVGVAMGADEIATNLRRMSLGAEVKGDAIEVTVGPTRHDVIHACDIYEDVAISYGYDKVLARATLPTSATIARQNPINKLSDAVRGGVAEAGFTEALTFSLCSIEDECERMRVSRGVRLQSLALISNPKTFEFQTARYSLLPGLLKTIQANKKMPLPLKLFEVSDVVRVGGGCNSDTGCYNERRLCAVYYNKSPGFELIVGLLDRIFELLEVKENSYKLVANEEGEEVEGALPWLFPGRRANVVVVGGDGGGVVVGDGGGVVVGSVGVLHPQVCTAFELTQPASALEINLEHFL